tara:strand:+ start:22 stop:867 length:846 start_codon:yes stop_codon:yes gene_type:complete
MKKLPFLHLATSDEVASTHLLTPYEVGCVWKLRLQLWENNSIPLKDDDSYLAKICNTTPKKFRSARVNFDYLFEKENGKIFHISDKEKWDHALNKSKVLSNNANIRWNNGNANAIEMDKELEPELKQELKLKQIDKGDEPRFDKSLWNKTMTSFKGEWDQLQHKRGSLVQGVKNYLSSIDDTNLDIPTIEQLFILYKEHQKQYSDQPRYITSLDKWISNCKWLEDTSFNIQQNLKEQSEADFQEEQDKKDWEFAKKMGFWFPAYSSERISRCERKYGSIAD